MKERPTLEGGEKKNQRCSEGSILAPNHLAISTYVQYDVLLLRRNCRNKDKLAYMVLPRNRN